MGRGLWGVAGALVLLASAGTSLAQTPEQVFILVRRTDTTGQTIARYYCDQRGVPRENIIALDLPAGDPMSWPAYQAKIVEPVRATLTRKKQVSAARCLLLIGQLPLKVEPEPQTAAEKREVQQLRDYVTKATLELYQQAWRVDQVSLGQIPGRPPTELPPNVPNSWEAAKYYKESLSRAEDVLAKLPEVARRPLADQLARIRAVAEGVSGQSDPEPTDTAAPGFAQRLDAWKKRQEQNKQEFDKLREQENLRGLASMREERRRKQLEMKGLLGALQQVNEDIGELASSARSSSLDSELAMLWRDNYRLNYLQGNPLFGRGIDLKVEEGQPPGALMVARLDAPDANLPVRLIDEAIAVEKAGEGLVGRFCLDAQGLSAKDPRAYDDQLVLQLEDWKERPASLTLAKETSLLPISATAANPVAFYIGWGSFDKYPGGYICARGAVAVTCNPAEAAELHDPRSRKWCNWLLSAGAVAVIGSVESADPRTFLDFRLFAHSLLVDNRTLAESFWRSCRGTSWRLILVGDPLYRPAGRKPAPPDKN